MLWRIRPGPRRAARRRRTRRRCRVPDDQRTENEPARGGAKQCARARRRQVGGCCHLLLLPSRPEHERSIVSSGIGRHGAGGLRRARHERGPFYVRTPAGRRPRPSGRTSRMLKKLILHRKWQMAYVKTLVVFAINHLPSHTQAAFFSSLPGRRPDAARRTPAIPSRVRRMRIALAQLNPISGDIDGNTRAVLGAMDEAASHGAEVLVAPEMVLTGYCIGDLIEDRGFSRPTSAPCSASPAMPAG